MYIEYIRRRGAARWRVIMKANVIYGSRNNDRQWMLVDGCMKTRLPGDIWRDSVWPQPQMRMSDIAYYLETGEMHEVTND